MSRIPKVRRWWVRYYAAGADAPLVIACVMAPTKTLARLQARPVIAVPYAVRRTVSTR